MSSSKLQGNHTISYKVSNHTHGILNCCDIDLETEVSMLVKA